MPLVTDTDVKIDVAGFAALSLGLVFTSTCNGDAIEAIIQALMMRGELELSSPFAKFLALGLGLLFLGRQEAVEPTVEVLFTRVIIPRYTIIALHVPHHWLPKVTACVSERPHGVQCEGPLLVWSYTLSDLLPSVADLQRYMRSAAAIQLHVLVNSLPHTICTFCNFCQRSCQIFLNIYWDHAST